MNFKFNNHKDNKNEKKQIWMYALILFAGAFIVLLLTAYSQVKFQNNISDYQNKLSSQEKAKINVVTSFNAAVKENKRLTAELEELRSKLVNSEQNMALEEARSIELVSIRDNTASTTDLLFAANDYYNKEEYIRCSVILKYDINTALLSPQAVKSYDELISKSYGKASQLLYREGYRSYKNKSYSDAILSFNGSINFSKKDEYYIDDAYYYLANSYYNISNFEAAKKIITPFIRDYPKSTFVREMEMLYDKMT